MGTGIGQSTNRKLMRDLRIYMAVGGMPQAVDAFVNGKTFAQIDFVKRNIITKKHPYNDIDEIQCITHEILLGKQNKPTSCSLSVHEYNCVGKAIVINENTAHNLVTILSVLSYPSYAQK